MSSGRAAIRRWLVTAPPFWAIPNWSTVENAMPSRWAAMVTRAPMVTTPVPPTPATRMLNGRPPSTRRGRSGSGSAASPAGTSTRTPPRRGVAPCTETKLGQKPSTHEKSLLQADWSIWRLRPYSVSRGSTERQFDFALQSPQPSHTRWLMNVRRSGSTIAPRLRRRRFSAAQVWS